MTTCGFGFHWLFFLAGLREILDRRFASGEIAAEEYQKARDLLEGRPPPAS